MGRCLPVSGFGDLFPLTHTLCFGISPDRNEKLRPFAYFWAGNAITADSAPQGPRPLAAPILCTDPVPGGVHSQLPAQPRAALPWVPDAAAPALYPLLAETWEGGAVLPREGVTRGQGCSGARGEGHSPRARIQVGFCGAGEGGLS